MVIGCPNMAEVSTAKFSFTLIGLLYLKDLVCISPFKPSILCPDVFYIFVLLVDSLNFLGVRSTRGR